MNQTLSKKQIKNWRRVLSYILGWDAFFLSEAEVEKYRDAIQEQIKEAKE